MLGVHNVFNRFMRLYLNNIYNKEIYVHVAKNRKVRSVLSLSNKKIPFYKNTRVYCVNFIYSCMPMNVKYYTCT